MLRIAVMPSKASIIIPKPAPKYPPYTEIENVSNDIALRYMGLLILDLAFR